MYFFFTKKVDIVPYLFDQDLEHLKHMELVSTIWIDPMAIMQSYPEEESRLTVAIRPFQLLVCNCPYYWKKNHNKTNFGLNRCGFPS